MLEGESPKSALFSADGADLFLGMESNEIKLWRLSPRHAAGFQLFKKLYPFFNLASHDQAVLSHEADKNSVVSLEDRKTYHLDSRQSKVTLLLLLQLKRIIL